MIDFRLNTRTLEHIKTTVGLDASAISQSDIHAVDEAIQAHTDKRLEMSTSVGGLQPRGSVYLMFRRFFTAKEIDRQLSRIKA